MTEIKPTWLYIKHHDKTQLKYFGCTTRYRAENYDGSGSYWSNHIKKHGRKFVVTDLIIGPYTNKEELQCLALWISEALDIVASPDWANLIPEDGMAFGGCPEGFKMTNEQCKRISEAKKGTPSHMKGKTYEELYPDNHQEIKLKISLATLGREPWMKGRQHSEETKALISKAGEGRITSDKTKAKQSASHTGKIRTEEHKRNNTEASREAHYCTPLIIDDVFYPSKKIAEKELNIRFRQLISVHSKRVSYITER